MFYGGERSFLLVVYWIGMHITIKFQFFSASDSPTGRCRHTFGTQLLRLVYNIYPDNVGRPREKVTMAVAKAIKITPQTGSSIGVPRNKFSRNADSKHYPKKTQSTENGVFYKVRLYPKCLPSSKFVSATCAIFSFVLYFEFRILGMLFLLDFILPQSCTLIILQNSIGSLKIQDQGEDVDLKPLP